MCPLCSSKILGIHTNDRAYRHPGEKERAIAARRKVGGADAETSAFRAGGSISSAIKQSNGGYKENAGIVGH